MKKLMTSATPGRVGLAVGVLALVVSVSGQAVGLPGTNKVDSGDIKNGQVKLVDMKEAHLRVGPTGAVIQTKGVLGTNEPVGNVLCLNLKFPARAGSATRTIDSGGDFTAPQIGLPPLPAELGCPSGFQDAVVQVPGQPDLNGTYAQFFG
jgi:hypothetical protein